MTEQPKCPPAIALIEDDPNVALMLTRHLQREGWTVRHAATVEDGRNLLASQPWDLLISDRSLPDGDGLQLCGELRDAAHPGYILMLTGESSDEAKLEGFERGADDYVTKPFAISELIARIRAGLRIVDLQKALVASNRRLAELSLTDGLTQIRNRRAFDAELMTRFDVARRYQRPLSAVLIDIDHFKAINDQHGHAVGDAVLQAVAAVLSAGTRKTDFIARYGGEEFAVLLPETPLLEALQVGEKVRAAVNEATIRAGGREHKVAISAGIASYPHSQVRSGRELVHAADASLYRAKANGRNRVEPERRRERFASFSPAVPHLGARVPRRCITEVDDNRHSSW
ncbi:MAG: diguanylate cyclase [Thermoanaerobaculia bacterium]|nr:diguanylate cyclase [Thermoanaerobaculia bacterium]